MPEAWKYLTTNILPQMRYADIEFDYGVDEFVTQTTTIKPKVEPAKTVPTCQPSQPEIVVEEEMGIIVATPNHECKETGCRRCEKRNTKGNKKHTKESVEVIYW